MGGSSTAMALRQLRVIPRVAPSLPRYYSSNVPVKAAPVGTMGNPVPSSPVDKIHPPIGPEYKSQGTSIGRTIRNIWKAGWKRAFWQIKEMNDTKVGTLVGVDKYPSPPRSYPPTPHQTILSFLHCPRRLWTMLIIVWEISIMKTWANCHYENDG